MLDPAYFSKPLTYQSVRHPRHGERNLEQRPVRTACLKPCPKPCRQPGRDNGGTSCKAA